MRGALKTPVETRWLSNNAMIQSFFAADQEMMAQLVERHAPERLPELHWINSNRNFYRAYADLLNSIERPLKTLEVRFKKK